MTVPLCQPNLIEFYPLCPLLCELTNSADSDVQGISERHDRTMLDELSVNLTTPRGLILAL